MAKLYFDKSEVVERQPLSEELLKLVERGITRVEQQRSFQSLYDIEIMGVAVYYRKNWRYDRVAENETKIVRAQA